MNYIDLFKTHLKIDRNLSDNTISGYVSDVVLASEFIGKPAEEITKSDVRGMFAALLDDGISRSTLNRKTIAIRSFFSYLNSIQVADELELKTARIDKTLPKPASESEIFALLDAAAECSLKDRLLAELLYGTGGRVSEVVSLKVEDIDDESAFLLLFGKGRKERNNPVHESCLTLIDAYSKRYNITKGYLFPHRSKVSHMTREALGKATKRWAVKAGIDPTKISPHVFRHSFATHLIDAGCDMAQVQELMGHEDIATTRIYAQVSKQTKKTTFTKFHPLSRT